MGSSSFKHRGGFALALALACLGLLAPAAGAVLQPPYTPNETLSLTGDCSTTPEIDEVPDPDCVGEPPAYPPPPDRPSARFNRPFGVAIDEWGNLYVASRSSTGLEGRIDIFDSEGHFISEMADPYGPWSIAVDSKGNLYAFERNEETVDSEVVRYPPDTYNPAAGEIEYDPADRMVVFTEFGFFGVAVDRSNDRLFVAAHQEIREYGSALEGNTLKATIKPAGLEYSTFVAVDAQRRLLYTTTCKEGTAKCVVWVFDADTHAFIKEIDGSNTAAGKFFSSQGRLSLAVDETNGHLFVGDLSATENIYEFDTEDEYSLVSSFKMPGTPLTAPMQSAVADNPKAPDPEDLNKADNYRHLYVPLSRTSGNALAFSPPDVTAPVVSDAAALGIASTEAELEALVNPRQAETTYRFEYLTETQFQEDGWEGATVADPGTLAASNKKQRVTTALTALSPGTAYRFRIVAENELGTGEDEATFTTYDDPPVSDDCPNQTLRTGPSAALPDCRAYELVTPADTNGGRPGGAGFEGDRFGQLQSRPDGTGVSFELAGGALPGTEATGGFHGDIYLSTRSDAGWSTALAGPTGTQASKPQPGSVSPDQGYSFWIAEGTGSAVIPGKGAHYVRYPDGTLELVGRGSLGEEALALGELITEDAAHIVFSVTAVREGQEITLGEETTGGTFTLSFKGSSTGPIPFNASSSEVESALVSLPDIGPGEVSVSAPGALTYIVEFTNSLGGINVPQLGADPSGLVVSSGEKEIAAQTIKDGGGRLEPEAPESGTAVYDRSPTGPTHLVSLLPEDVSPIESASYLGASPEGEGIAFEIDGTLYLRKENEVTYKIAEGLSFAPTKPAPEDFVIEGLAGVSAGAERVFYVKDGDLEAFETETEDTITFADTATEVIPVNIAPAGNRAYFVSETAIVGSGPNQAGEEPQAGEPNLYLSEGEGTPTFIATVTDRDVEGIPAGTGVILDGLGLWTLALQKGQKATDPSRTTPDGGVLLFQSRADLADYDSGEDPQIYRYEAGDGSLACLSCPPTGDAPTGGALLQSIASIDVAPPLSPYGFVPNLAKDGERVFFESTEALVSADTNAKRDVYEWEEDEVGSCDRAGGCVYLISSGRGDKDSYLFGHSQSGDDVFFTTNDILVGGDEATLSVYDAKVGGGFALVPEAPCQDEECRPLITPPPSVPAPESGVQGRSGNVEPGRRKCPRGKRAVKRKGGKVVCVKKKKQRKAAKTRRGKRG